MKKYIIAILLLSIFSISFSTYVNPIFPRRAHSETNNKFQVLCNSNTSFDVIVFLPPNMKINKWNVNSSEFNYWFESKYYNYKGKDWNAYHWHFKGGNYKIEFFSTSPEVNKDLDILVLWMDKNGNFKEIDKRFMVYTGNVPPPICGNGICENGENFFTCPSDCGGVLSYVSIILLGIGLVLGISLGITTYLRRKEYQAAIKSEYNIDKLIAYVKNAIKANVPEYEIKRILYKAGWDPKVVDYVIKKVKK